MRSNHQNYHRRHEGTVGIFLFVCIAIIITISLLSFFLFRKTNESAAKDIRIKQLDSIVAVMTNLPPKEVVKHDTLYLPPPQPEKKPFKAIFLPKDSLLVKDSAKIDTLGK